jgi:hypothetical protein
MDDLSQYIVRVHDIMQVLKSPTATLRRTQYSTVYMNQAIRNKLSYLLTVKDSIGPGDQPEKEALSATLSLSAETLTAGKRGLLPRRESTNFAYMQKKRRTVLETKSKLTRTVLASYLLC